MKSDHLGHHLGATPGSTARRRRPGPRRVRPSLRSVPSNASGVNRRGQHALHHQHALGDHQALAGGQVRPAVDAVQIAEIVQPRVGGIVDVDDVGSHGFRRRCQTSDRPPRSRVVAFGRLERLQPLVLSHSWLARRSASISSVPAVRHRHQYLPAVGRMRDARPTKPSSASEAITRVIDGGRTRSRMANAPGVIGPLGQRRQCRQLRQRNRGIADAETAIAGRDGSPPATSRWPAGLSTSFTARRLRQNAGSQRANHADTSPSYLITMSATTSARAPEPPPLPAVLLEPWPVIAVGAAGWLIATRCAFTLPGLHDWRPVTVAGLAIGCARHVDLAVAQRRAAHAGARAGAPEQLNLNRGGRDGSTAIASAGRHQRTGVARSGRWSPISARCRSGVRSVG